MKLILLGILVAATACIGTETRDVGRLRDAIDHSRVTIHDMVAVAEASMADGRAVSAELVLDGTAVYSYGTVGANTLMDVRVDTVEGNIVSTARVGSSSDSCTGSISLAEAIALAETEVPGGTVIAAIPDDDVHCAREIQVLDPTLLWEVKVAGDGQILELEESDETED
ncbi:MAG: PepSY domain-containing protein [Kofleriaceae bacterium]